MCSRWIIYQWPIFHVPCEFQPAVQPESWHRRLAVPGSNWEYPNLDAKAKKLGPILRGAKWLITEYNYGNNHGISSISWDITPRTVVK